jgi:hypothetical protein
MFTKHNEVRDVHAEIEHENKKQKELNNDYLYMILRGIESFLLQLRWMVVTQRVIDLRVS